jgi:hypothetical protein
MFPLKDCIRWGHEQSVIGVNVTWPKDLTRSLSEHGLFFLLLHVEFHFRKSWDHDETEIWLVLVDCSLWIIMAGKMMIATSNLVHMLLFYFILFLNCGAVFPFPLATRWAETHGHGLSNPGGRAPCGSHRPSELPLTPCAHAVMSQSLSSFI